jgi:class 3 adenylate cyclase
VFSTASNAAVVRVPGRRFPGVVIQGDSLSILQADVRQARALAREDSQEARQELADVLMDLEEKLSGYLAVYEQTLRAHGMALPYPVRAQDE